MQEGFPFQWRIVIVSNGSTDSTGDLGRALAARHADIQFLSLDQRGRGRALRHAWTVSSADAVCYMDADLSTGLAFLQPLVEAILKDGYDIATGSRLLHGARTNRSFRREAISRIYNWIVWLAFRTRIKDSQCGFKAASRRAVQQVLPQVEDQCWFFDTELLVLAQASGLAVKEIPVVWHEDPDSRVKIISTAWDDLRGIVHLWLSLKRSGAGLPGQPPLNGVEAGMRNGEDG